MPDGGYLTSSSLSGRILRVLPTGSVLALSTLAAALALLGFSITASWPLLLVFGFVAGLAGGDIDAGLNAYGARHFSARILHWLHAFFGLGTTLGPLIVTAVLTSGNVWRWSYVIVGSAQVLLALTFFATRQRWENVASGETGLRPVRSGHSCGFAGEAGGVGRLESSRVGCVSGRWCAAAVRVGGS